MQEQQLQAITILMQNMTATPTRTLRVCSWERRKREYNLQEPCVKESELQRVEYRSHSLWFAFLCWAVSGGARFLQHVQWLEIKTKFSCSSGTERDMGRVAVVRKGRFSCSSYSTGNTSLERRSLFLVFLPFFLVLFSKKTMAVSTSLNYTKYKQVSSLRLARIQRHLDKINKPPVFTIQVIKLYIYMIYIV